ncbi:MAG: hypothetical protein LH480_11750 [Rubrivivax sp.]|nr:hypothetical protein [Rubrivivax sp.]
MFRSTSFRSAAAVAAAILTASCGGGNDNDAGSLVAFNIVPSSISFTGTNATTCGGGTGRVYVYGGAGPYRVDNTGAGYVAISKATLDRPGDFVDVTVTSGQCITNIQVVVIDQLGRQVNLAVSSVKGT